MGRIRIGGLLLHCEEHGSGRALLGIHGTGSSAVLWARAAPELARRGRLILYDRRGCGRSERPAEYRTTGVAEHADDAAALLHALDAVPAVVLGRSYGGEVALDLARRRPGMVDALVLLEPSMPRLSAPMRAWWDEVGGRIREAARRAGPAAAGESLCREVFGDDGWDALPAEIRKIFLDNGPAVLAEVNGDWTAPDAAALAHLTQPTLIISGEESPAAFRAADDALAAMMPHARRVVVGGGHLIDPAGPEVLAFLDDVLGREDPPGT
jgi:pimeloyl-ACP methyl ester carboxylesterase